MITLGNLVLADNFIYTIENQKSVIKINLDTGTSEQLLETDYLNDSIPHLYLLNNSCYYYDGITSPKNSGPS